MRYSQLFGKTIRDVSGEVKSKGYEYLLRGGFIRESAAGRFYVLPLGLKVQDRICQIVEEEMNAAGTQKLNAPILHPLDLWEETSRSASVSFELMQVKDRSSRAFVLGGTAEEMMVALVRQFAITFKDLPFCIYQFSTKFRDELRVRGGLLRAREFLMKDGYSFHASREDFEKYYQRMAECYCRIFERLELPVRVVASDNGYMGGEYCHEFIVDHQLGESRYLASEDGTYSAHEDIAVFRRDSRNLDEALQSLSAAGANLKVKELENSQKWRMLNNYIYYTDNSEAVLVSIRGDLEISEAKLKHVLKCNDLRLATTDEIAQLGSSAGYVSPLKLRLRHIGDLSLASVRNFVTGGDQHQSFLSGVNYQRDFSTELLADIAIAQDGHHSVETGSPLKAQRGIEVGNIFQLGTWYSKRMQNASFINNQGQRQHYYMGCYGIGIGRTLQTIAELHHDDKGLVWPKSCSPYDCHLISLGKEESVKAYAEEIYNSLTTSGKEVLFDEREVSAGIKFTDADLIGISQQLIASKRTMQNELVELRCRSDGSTCEVKKVTL